MGRGARKCELVTGHRSQVEHRPAAASSPTNVRVCRPGFWDCLDLGGVTTLIVSLVGAGLLPVALADWIKEVQHAE
jgi:hypothetical protein